MTQRAKRVIRIVLTGAAGGQADQFLRLIAERDDLLVVGLVEAHDRAEARRRANRCDAEQRRKLERRTRRPRNQPRARQRGRGLPRCRVFETVEMAISEVSFDLAIVCTRPEQHAREIIACLLAGKRVLAEKPPTVSLDEMIAIAEAERESDGWVAWNFQLYWMWRAIRGHIQAGELGIPLVDETVWVRGLIAASEQAREEESGVRRGQRGRPMVDLCHMVDAAIGLLRGARPERVLGVSYTAVDRITGRVSTYETLTARVRFQWDGEEAFAQLRIVCGFNIPLHGEHALEEVRVTCQGSRGSGTIRLPVDERVISDRALAPRDFRPQFTRLERTENGEELQASSVKSPQPITVFECLGLTLDWVVGMIASGETHTGGPHGVRVMQLLEAFEESVRLGEEVAVRQVD